MSLEYEVWSVFVVCNVKEKQKQNIYSLSSWN